MSNDLEVEVAARLHEADRYADVPSPDLEDLKARVGARRKRRRRRLAVTGALAVIVGATSVVVLLRSESSGRLQVAISPASGSSTANVPRPILKSCDPSYAFNASTKGPLLLIPPESAEVFADPDRGASGPLAVLYRHSGPAAPPDGVAGGLIATTNVGGRDANLQINPDESGLQGGATWDLAGGGTATAYTAGLTGAELQQFVEQVDSGGSALPGHMRSIGMTGTTENGTSACMAGQQVLALITEIHGTQASRYAQVLGTLPGASRFDVGDSTFIVAAPAGDANRFGTAFREATPEEWAALVKKYPAGGSPTCVVDGGCGAASSSAPPPVSASQP